jgi:hypothetical protein
MIDGWIIVALSFLYIGGLFGVAYWEIAPGGANLADGAALCYARSPHVGSAAAKGSIIAVYLDRLPPLLWRPLPRRIADQDAEHHLSPTYRRSLRQEPAVAAIVTVVAVGALPYIACSSGSLAVVNLFLAIPREPACRSAGRHGLLVALILAAFTILFGARQTDTEHQRGLMLAIAAKSLVKLAASSP